MVADLLPLFLVSVFGFVVFIALMSVGVVFRKKPIKGSCGGLNAVLGENGSKSCGVCGIEVSEDWKGCSEPGVGESTSKNP